MNDEKLKSQLGTNIAAFRKRNGMTQLVLAEKLNFSDPWPKERHAKRRLTSPGFLKLYYSLLPAGALVEFKTDNTALFDYSLEMIGNSDWTLTASTYDLYSDPEMLRGNVPTEYEEKFREKGNKICKLILEKQL